MSNNEDTNTSQATQQQTQLTGDNVAVPAHMIPSFRTWKALEAGIERNLLFRTWGGLGDQICAEPTLRYAFEAFKDCNISLVSDNSFFYKHLPFKRVFDSKEEQPRWEKYFLFDTIVPSTHLTWQFFSHCVTNCVDFPSLCALRCQLPVKNREIHLVGDRPADEIAKLLEDKSVLVHPGKHWPSKTFPKPWWDAVLAGLVAQGITPVIIGGNADDNRTTVDVDTSGCVDLRDKTSLSESIWLLQRATVLLTNDSLPLHMAASVDPQNPESSGNTWIGFVATCKHPDYITHWRKGQWQWREHNFGLGGMWEIIDHCPNKKDEVTVDEVDIEILKTWLPEPEVVTQWTQSKLLRP